MEAFRTGSAPHLCQPPYNTFERGIEKDLMPYCRRNRITLMTYGALCRGLLSGNMSRDRDFQGDDLRQIDPKFQKPRFNQYLKAVERIKRLAREIYGKQMLETAVRWILDQGVDIAIWGARRPHQLQAVKEVFGWSIDAEFKRQVEKVISETINDPVGPDFMAPPSEENQTNIDTDDLVKDDLKKVL
jgi:aryl-alcohol dehydrogenase-like predicted oxidoreductase